MTWMTVAALAGGAALLTPGAHAVNPPIAAPLNKQIIVIPGPAPASVNASVTPISAYLSWPAVAGASGYLVARGPGPGGPFTLLTPAPITQTGLLDPGLTPNTTYSWTVTAVSGVRRGTSAP